MLKLFMFINNKKFKLILFFFLNINFVCAQSQTARTTRTHILLQERKNAQEKLKIALAEKLKDKNTEYRINALIESIKAIDSEISADKKQPVYVQSFNSRRLNAQSNIGLLQPKFVAIMPRNNAYDQKEKEERRRNLIVAMAALKMDLSPQKILALEANAFEHKLILDKYAALNTNQFVPKIDTNTQSESIIYAEWDVFKRIGSIN
jgi:Zn-dependent metalloprotease